MIFKLYLNLKINDERKAAYSDPPVLSTPTRVRPHVGPLELFGSPTRDLGPEWLHVNKSQKERRPFLRDVGDTRSNAGMTQHEPRPAQVATREEMFQWQCRGTQEILSRHS